MRVLPRGILVTFLLLWCAGAVHAQGSGASVVLQHWSLNTALGDSLRLVSAQQVVLPLSYQTAIGGRWSINAAGAYTTGQATFRNEDGAETTRTLAGPTDIRVRATGSFFRDALSLAVGVNLPTGRTSLDQEELLALRVLASPAAGMPAPVLGSGFGATAGFIVARTMRGWAIAAGATYEQRGSYAATEQLTAGLATPTRIEPGPTGHISLGATGAVGNGEMSLYAAGDVFGTDALQVAVDPTPVETRYRLGPMFNINWTYNPGIRRLPDLTTSAAVRVRTAFQDDARGSIPGSGGTFLTGGAAATLFRIGSWRIREALDVRTFTGLDVDSTFVTAKFHEVGLVTTVNVPMGRTSFEPFLRLGVGSVRPGTVSSATRTIALGGRVTAR